MAATLARDHRRFLRFLKSKVDDADAAEEILQSAYLTSMRKAGELRDRESAVAWFYRLLRNAAVDHIRTASRHQRAGQRLANEQVATTELDELRHVACRCVAILVPDLRPEYAIALRRIDLEDASVSDVAAELGITANNAGVRLHRARQALRRKVQSVCGACATHGCHDCSCGHGTT